jgi:hypothetical protein
MGFTSKLFVGVLVVGGLHFGLRYASELNSAEQNTSTPDAIDTESVSHSDQQPADQRPVGNPGTVLTTAPAHLDGMPQAAA